MGRTTIDAILRPFNNSDRARPPQRSVYSIPRLSGFFGRIEKSNFFHATNCFMTEFAEAQCFYVIALTIAIIYSDTQGATFNSTVNYQSIFLNQDMGFSIVFCASTPILIVQFCLIRIFMDSIYNLIFSTTALVLSGVTAISLWHTTSSDMVATKFWKEKVLEECGGAPSLRTFCLASASRLPAFGPIHHIQPRG